MYRAVGAVAINRAIPFYDADALGRLAAGTRVRIDGRKVLVDSGDYTDRIYDSDVSEASSQVAQFPGVRLAVVAQLRALGRGGVLMAGRDIGTDVFPDADFKFYLTASTSERARRRAGAAHESWGVRRSGAASNGG